MSNLMQILFERRKTSNDLLSDGVGLVLYSEESLMLVDFNKAILQLANTPDSKLLSLLNYDMETVFESSIVGTITWKNVQEEDEGGNSFQAAVVATSAAQKGYGPIMYFILAEVSKGYIMPDTQISKQALAVWRKFYDNTKVPVRSTSRTPNWGASNPVSYAYKPRDPSLSIPGLKEEASIGLKDLQEQLQERLEALQGKMDAYQLRDAKELLTKKGLLALLRNSASRFFGGQYANRQR